MEYKESFDELSDLIDGMNEIFAKMVKNGYDIDELMELIDKAKEIIISSKKMIFIIDGYKVNLEDLENIYKNMDQIIYG